MASASLSGLSSRDPPGLRTREVSSFWNGVVGGVARGTWGAPTPSRPTLPVPYTELSAQQSRNLQLHEDVSSRASALQEAS